MPRRTADENFNAINPVIRGLFDDAGPFSQIGIQPQDFRGNPSPDPHHLAANELNRVVNDDNTKAAIEAIIGDTYAEAKRDASHPYRHFHFNGTGIETPTIVNALYKEVQYNYLLTHSAGNLGALITGNAPAVKNAIVNMTPAGIKTSLRDAKDATKTIAEIKAETDRLGLPPGVVDAAGRPANVKEIYLDNQINRIQIHRAAGTALHTLVVANLPAIRTAISNGNLSPAQVQQHLDAITSPNSNKNAIRAALTALGLPAAAANVNDIFAENQMRRVEELTMVLPVLAAQMAPRRNLILAAIAACTDIDAVNRLIDRLKNSPDTIAEVRQRMIDLGFDPDGGAVANANAAIFLGENKHRKMKEMFKDIPAVADLLDDKNVAVALKRQWKEEDIKPELDEQIRNQLSSLPVPIAPPPGPGAAKAAPPPPPPLAKDDVQAVVDAFIRRPALPALVGIAAIAHRTEDEKALRNALIANADNLRGQARVSEFVITQADEKNHPEAVLKKFPRLQKILETKDVVTCMGTHFGPVVMPVFPPDLQRLQNAIAAFDVRNATQANITTALNAAPPDGFGVVADLGAALNSASAGITSDGEARYLVFMAQLSTRFVPEIVRIFSDAQVKAELMQYFDAGNLPADIAQRISRNLEALPGPVTSAAVKNAILTAFTPPIPAAAPAPGGPDAKWTALEAKLTGTGLNTDAAATNLIAEVRAHQAIEEIRRINHIPQVNEEGGIALDAAEAKLVIEFRNPHRTVKEVVNRLTDAEKVEQALTDYGIPTTLQIADRCRREKSRQDVLERCTNTFIRNFFSKDGDELIAPDELITPGVETAFANFNTKMEAFAARTAGVIIPAAPGGPVTDVEVNAAVDALIAELSAAGATPRHTRAPAAGAPAALHHESRVTADNLNAVLAAQANVQEIFKCFVPDAKYTAAGGAQLVNPADPTNVAGANNPATGQPYLNVMNPEVTPPPFNAIRDHMLRKGMTLAPGITRTSAQMSAIRAIDIRQIDYPEFLAKLKAVIAPPLPEDDKIISLDEFNKLKTDHILIHDTGRDPADKVKQLIEQTAMQAKNFDSKGLIGTSTSLIEKIEFRINDFAETVRKAKSNAATRGLVTQSIKPLLDRMRTQIDGHLSSTRKDVSELSGFVTTFERFVVPKPGGKAIDENATRARLIAVYPHTTDEERNKLLKIAKDHFVDLKQQFVRSQAVVTKLERAQRTAETTTQDVKEVEEFVAHPERAPVVAFGVKTRTFNIGVTDNVVDVIQTEIRKERNPGAPGDEAKNVGGGALRGGTSRVINNITPTTGQLTVVGAVAGQQIYIANYVDAKESNTIKSRLQIDPALTIEGNFVRTLRTQGFITEFRKADKGTEADEDDVLELMKELNLNLQSKHLLVTEDNIKAELLLLQKQGRLRSDMWERNPWKDSVSVTNIAEKLYEGYKSAFGVVEKGKVFDTNAPDLLITRAAVCEVLTKLQLFTAANTTKYGSATQAREQMVYTIESTGCWSAEFVQEIRNFCTLKGITCINNSAYRDDMLPEPGPKGVASRIQQDSYLRTLGCDKPGFSLEAIKKADKSVEEEILKPMNDAKSGAGYRPR